MAQSDPQIINHTIDVSLVHQLLVEQHPDLAHLRLTPVGQGWDNAVFRLGGELAVRLPRRAATVAMMENEQRWLPQLAPQLPLSVPVPVRTGRAGAGFPWPWSIVRWFPGTASFPPPPFDAGAVARSLGRFLRALHRPAPPEAPDNAWRSVPLDGRTARLHEHLDQLHDTRNRERILALWDRLVVTPRWLGPRTWIHGDLHPANLLIDNGLLSAVLDFGDVTAGDPAADFSVMWTLLAPEHRLVLFTAAGRSRSNPDDEHVWRRARGWALAIGVAVVAMGQAGDPMVAMGRHAIQAALAGD